MSGDSDGQYKWLFLISGFVCAYQQDLRENPSAFEYKLLAISGYETRLVESFKSGDDF